MEMSGPFSRPATFYIVAMLLPVDILILGISPLKFTYARNNNNNSSAINRQIITILLSVTKKVNADNQNQTL